MPRQPRLHYPGAYYHVILRGNDRQDIFFIDQDRFRFYLLLQECVERFGHTIFAFCLMTNHAHLLCQVHDVPLSRVMQNVAFRYARWVNWRHGKSGHVFQGRYKAILVDADQYLLQLVSYIHLNPVRAKMISDPGGYPWSSHRAFIGKEVISWLASAEILSYFGMTKSKAQGAFNRFVCENMKEGHRKEFQCGSRVDNRVLGEEEFVETVLTGSEGELIQKPNIDVILKAVEGLYELPPGELAKPGKSFRLAEARSFAAWAVRDLSSETLTELGRILGRDVTTLSSGIRRLEERMKHDNKLAETQEKLKSMVMDIATSQA